jgi:hypothetical protein
MRFGVQPAPTTVGEIFSRDSRRLGREPLLAFELRDDRVSLRPAKR